MRGRARTRSPSPASCRGVGRGGVPSWTRPPSPISARTRSPSPASGHGVERGGVPSWTRPPSPISQLEHLDSFLSLVSGNASPQMSEPTVFLGPDAARQLGPNYAPACNNSLRYVCTIGGEDGRQEHGRRPGGGARVCAQCIGVHWHDTSTRRWSDLDVWYLCQQLVRPVS